MLHLGLTSMPIAQFPEIRPSGNLRGKKGEPVLKTVELELRKSIPPASDLDESVKPRNHYWGWTSRFSGGGFKCCSLAHEPEHGLPPALTMSNTNPCEHRAK